MSYKKIYPIITVARCIFNLFAENQEIKTLHPIFYNEEMRVIIKVKIFSNSDPDYLLFYR